MEDGQGRNALFEGGLYRISILNVQSVCSPKCVDIRSFQCSESIRECNLYDFIVQIDSHIYSLNISKVLSEASVETGLLREIHVQLLFR
jgi:hypothetical protein